ncbi:uncharacterized protein AB675_10237 [Cyphellophora attinorum]|uniref:Uncharacterized protein n=1 Tax=Cyphellophora attinorum TaxID=1664694 RepID=A0A0N0NK35_9EURO|nr:uncharacterized protein AB675_10237 [Phialophora attinorum]KPI37359.1 hypothetical protein AB675_10237 [Phialophora attinorum]
MRGWGLFFFLLFLVVIIIYAAWILWTQYKARQAGSRPQFGNTTGPIEWIKDQISKLRNPRSARGAYEETGSGADGGYTPASARGRGRGFEDDAWDTRVGGAHDDDPYDGRQQHGGGGYAANYEEQELGLAPTSGLHAEPYGGASGDYNTSRGRSGGDNPFGDENAAPSLRSVSPRPEVDGGRSSHRPQLSADSAGSYDGGAHGGGGSPTGTRKSAFREDM